MPSDSKAPEYFTPGEHFRRNVLPKLIWMGVPVLIVVAVAICFGPDLVSRIKTWRAHKLVDFAAVHKQAGNEVEMRDKLLQAYGLSPYDKQVLKAMAHDYASSPQESLQFKYRLATGSDASREDRIEFFEAALGTGVISIAQSEFEKALKDPATKSDDKLSELCSNYLIRVGDTKRALEWTGGAAAAKEEVAASASPTAPPPKPVISANPKLNLTRAKLLLDTVRPNSAGLTQTAQEVVALLDTCAQSEDASSRREASLLLARLYVTLVPVREVVDTNKAREILKSLGEWFGEERWEARLVAADLEMFLDKDSAQRLFDELIEESKKATEPTRLDLARWLNARKQPERAQKLAESQMTPEKPSRDWFLIKMDAMASANKWAEIETILLDAKGVPIEESLGRLFLWRAAKEMKSEPAVLEQRMAVVLQLAEKAPAPQGFYIASYLEKFGEQDRAASIYQKHTMLESTAMPAFLGLVRCLSADPKQSSMLRDVLEQMLARFPSVREAQNDLAYLNLLDGRKLGESSQTVLSLAKDSPEVLAYRTSLALAQLQAGQFKDAEKTYEGITLDWTKISPGWRAVRSAVLAANGQKDQAATIVQGLDQSTLRDGERKLLERFAVPITPSGTP
ncbi:hypothetical protein [Roseimicrobium sp. ORNL1]|uniref:hypothetical protein n=1 Tax=Roseimicrobium sp. ORNL1 TaxID=2711231 RepID=UPI0013E0F685|nr:hypothetical protein [Roseimicrobium sp. ORNL1]QIF02914.1 hypothetical protein G5S37_15765 [Roseimicrobium sp. ORNL1]